MKTMSKKEAIKYVYEHKNGSLSDLRKVIGTKNVKSLELTGFIQRGQETTKVDSWASTKSTERLYNSYFAKDEHSILQFFLDKFNCLLMKRSSRLSSL